LASELDRNSIQIQIWIEISKIQSKYLGTGTNYLGTSAKFEFKFEIWIEISKIQSKYLGTGTNYLGTSAKIEFKFEII